MASPHIQHEGSDSIISHSWEHKVGQHGWGNEELQNYTTSAANSFASGAKVVLRAAVDSAQSHASERYTSARLVHRQNIGSGGTLRFRVTAPVAAGIWPAIWLLPREPFSWPTDGEIDLLEVANGSAVNTSCLHWGHYNAEDHFKHRVVKTALSAVASAQGETFSFAWEGGRAVWYVAGRAVMKAIMPSGSRPLREFNLVANIAMGGTLCNHTNPKDGTYDMIIHELSVVDELPTTFDSDFRMAAEGTS